MERKKKYRCFLCIILAVCLVLMAAYGVLFLKGRQMGRYQLTFNGYGFTLSEKETAEKEETPVYLMPSGVPVGLYIQTRGMMVLGTQKITDITGEVSEPAKGLICSGDYIESVNGEPVETTADFTACMEKNGGAAAELLVRREEETEILQITPVQTGENEYKLGIWIRDDTQGIGTVTFINDRQLFGALGHGITDIDTSRLIDISGGRVYEADILSIVRGSAGSPGEMVGRIDYQQARQIGQITDNTAAGIYGTLSEEILAYDPLKALPAADKSQVHTGAASLMCTIGRETDTYDIEIEKISGRMARDNKSFVIHITDEKLLDMTGGVIQGMSGAPIIQDGRIIGAVTHVFVDDPTRGYGIFIENMLKGIKNVVR